MDYLMLWVEVLGEDILVSLSYYGVKMDVSGYRKYGLDTLFGKIRKIFLTGKENSEIPLIPCRMCGVFCCQSIVKAYSEGFGKHSSVFRVSAVACPHMALLDEEGHTFHLSGCIVASGLAVFHAHEPPQFSG